MNQQTNVQVVAVAGGLTAIGLWVISFFAPEFMAAAPTGAEAAITTVIAAIIGLFVKSTTTVIGKV